MSRRSSAARIGAQTATGGVAVVADSSAIGSSSALPDAFWITARIHQDLRGHTLTAAAVPGAEAEPEDREDADQQPGDVEPDQDVPGHDGDHDNEN